MDTIHIIVENTVVVENGEVTTNAVVLPHYGYYEDCGEAYQKTLLLNNEWGLEKSLHPDGCHKEPEDHLDDYYCKYGALPYDYVTLRKYDWMLKNGQ